MGNYFSGTHHHLHHGRRKAQHLEDSATEDLTACSVPVISTGSPGLIKSSFSILSSHHHLQQQQQRSHSLGPTAKISVCRSSRSASRASSGGGGSSSKKTTISSHDSSATSEEVPCSEIEKLRLELRDAKRQIYEREQQLLKLHREIHKLRSVLDHSDAINALKPSLSMTMLLADGAGVGRHNGKLSYPNKKQGVSGESYGSMTSLGDPMQNVNFVWKDFDCRRIIQEALLDNSFLKNYLNQEQMDLIVDSMYEKEFSKSCYICRRGTYGSHLYVITYGHCEVIDAHDKPVNQMGPGKAFGELALLYNCTRTASVKTITRVRTWVLDRKVFQMIMMKTCLDRSQTIKQFLKSVPVLQNLSDEKISKISDVVEVDYYPRGEYIVRQGSFGESFFIISKGMVRVTQVRQHKPTSSPDGKCTGAPVVKEETLRTLSIGDYFGEQALLLGLSENDAFTGEESAAIRTANVVSEDCECLVLDHANFFTLIGDLNEIKYKSYNDENENSFEDEHISYKNNNSNNNNAVFSPLKGSNDLTGKAANSSLSQSNTLSVGTNNAKKEFDEPKKGSVTPDPFFYRLTLDDLEHICQLGMGGFGIVHLVKSKSSPNRVFALKKCSKEFVRASHQEQHIINEKLVMQRVSGKHQFVVQLFRTFRDDKSVYFLMETALGGELWTVLRQRGPFGEQAARFYMACVIEALQYLHSNNIIYRDLKPENCLLDADGFLKLTDFGFSKFLQPGDKTWTFCGTPEYVAPEIVLNRGHDKAVDIWSIGILLYELLTGLPPFTSPDPLQTYHIILRGFDSIGFDEGTFSKQCVNLIRALCRENPSERLGIRGRNGYADIKKHKWFSGFNWNHLVARKLVPPIVPQLSSTTDTRYFDTVVLQSDGNKLSPGGGGGKASWALRKNSAKLSNSSPNTSSTCSSETKLTVSKMNHEGSKESSLLEYSYDWESYF